MYKNKQKLNIAIIITTISVIVILLVVLGIIIFQKTSDNDKTNKTTVGTTIATTNLTTTNPTTSSTTTTTPTTTTTTPNTKTGDENFEITQWGVTGYYNGSYQAEYLITGGTVASFTSSDLTGNCTDRIVGIIQKLSADETYPSVGSTQTVEEVYYSGNEVQRSNIKFIGSYYYVYISPQVACYQTGSTTPDPIYMNVSDAIHDYFDTLVAV